MSTATINTPVTYQRLPLAGLIPQLVPPVSLYLPTDKGQVRLYRSADLPIELNDIYTLRARCIEELLVDAAEYYKVKDFLASNLSQLLADETHPPARRLRLLNQVVCDTLRETLVTDDAEEMVHRTRKLAEQVVEVGLRSEVAIRDVAKIADHDHCTFTHSANVATYSTLLAKALGITDVEELRQIAAAGMLHDVGKLKIPSSILNKPGRLTKEEVSLIRLHPTRGFQQLRRAPELTPGQLMVVYQHHEWMNGKGYPVGCIDNELHSWARICAVADVFEALTGKRPYRRPSTIAETLAIMGRESGTHFDEEIFQCWKSQFVDPSQK